MKTLMAPTPGTYPGTYPDSAWRGWLLDIGAANATKNTEHPLLIRLVTDMTIACDHVLISPDTGTHRRNQRC